MGPSQAFTPPYALCRADMAELRRAKPLLLSTVGAFACGGEPQFWGKAASFARFAWLTLADQNPRCGEQCQCRIELRSGSLVIIALQG